MRRGVLEAVEVVAERARQARDAGRVRVQDALGERVDSRAVAELAAGLRRHSRITLNFHPDRFSRDGRSVASGLLKTGRVRPQCETGISNGGRSAVPGGDRARWERSLFGAIYDDPHPSVGGRPVYGSLDITGDPHGGSPRFGSSFLILEDACFDRATFCVGDSHSGPTDVGTAEYLEGVLAGVFEQGVAGEGLDRGLTVEGLKRMLVQSGSASHPARTLDGYVEAQIHGGVLLERDVSAVVLDPSFAPTQVGVNIQAAAERFGFDVRFHRGSELPVGEVPGDFRGPEMPALAAQVADSRDFIDAVSIGRRANHIPFTPPTPRGDPPGSERQQIKFLWHCLLRFGRDGPD